METSSVLHAIICLHIFSRNYRTSAFLKIKIELLLDTEGTKEINQSQWYELNILFQGLFWPIK